jgi:hypothetical protein
MARANRKRFTSEQVGKSHVSDDVWTDRERIADSAFSQSQKLASMAGPVEVAKEALKSTVEPLTALQKHEVAKQLGYDSFEALIAASMVVTLEDGSAWCFTRDRSGAWTPWNVCALDLPAQFKTKEEAIRVIHDSHN